MSHNAGRRMRRGFTLLEVTIVLGVIAVLSAALWTTLNKVMANHRLGQATEQINTLVGKMRDLYTGQRAAIISDGRAGLTPGNAPCTNFTTTGNCNISAVLGAKANFYSPDIARGGLPFNPWNGRYEVWMINTRGDFAISVQGLTPQSCADLISRIPAIGTRNAATTANPVPTAVLRAGNLQNGAATNIFYHNGTNWTDVTGLNPDLIANDAAFDNCTTLSIYYTL